MGPDLVLQKTVMPDGPIGQFRAVVLTGNENGKQADAAGAFVVGFCQDEIDQEDVDRGRLAAVRVMGISRAVSAGAINANAPVAVTANGRVTTAAAGNFVIGRCVTPVTQADDWTAVFLTHEGAL